jgi:CheY-like chemotaxis protein
LLDAKVDEPKEVGVQLGRLVDSGSCRAPTGCQARIRFQAPLAEFDQLPPDVILSDIGMPVMDGNEMIRLLRAKEAMKGAPPVPALALTAFAGERSRTEALESGYQVWMPKPVEPTQILSALDELVSR